jgi:aryl-alcohol dehydrogenase-like predicted oxidoreductase
MQGAIRREVEDSLRRLKVETIDLYQCHWPDPERLEEGWTVMADLQRQGKVRWIGVSNYSREQLEKVQAIAAVTSVQPRYSMIHRAAEEEVFPVCGPDGIGVIVYSPMHSGLLTGAMTAERVGALPQDDWRRENPDFQEPRLSRHLRLVELLRQIGTRHGRTVSEVAIAWALRLPVVTGAIVGGRSSRQVDGWSSAEQFRMAPGEIEEIDHFLKENPVRA